MSAANEMLTDVYRSWRGSEEGWNESNGSILTTLEPVAIMPPGYLAASGTSGWASVRGCRPSVAIKTADLYKHESQVF